MSSNFTDAELEAYLDEALNSARAAQLESATESDPELIERLAMINRRRDAGLHTLGEIWRQHQIGVPTREQMGNFLLNVLPEQEQEYIKFRIESLKCPYTIACLKDLKELQAESDDLTESRRKKYFHSSAGLLKKDKRKDD